ncbi:hypothetical protein [Streptomyces sp. MI02-7b]|uniref:hypothetical protein n=1 Tax=Streptomyces sp. MI02-7b TaxID=462941 RepID=UPI0029B9DD81|nr:hypothetical protein [Streptomyces sp. MI02-7b]MDX3070997.1 hypothetical protein [Streptomyces sp. MI02-7b]
MTRKWCVFLGGFGIAVLAALTGCSPLGVGVTGITVAEDGTPVGVMLVCHDHIDGASLYDVDADEADEIGSWSRRKPATGFSVWSLRTGGRGWRAGTPLAALDPHHTYTLRGWTDNHSAMTFEVTFTAAQLARLEPGQVRYLKGEGPGTDRDGYATVSMDAFRADACRDV